MSVSVIMPVKLLNDEIKELTQIAVDSLLKTADKADMEIVQVHDKGYPEAVNYGMTQAKGDLVAIANNDIRVMSNWLNVAKDILQENSDVGSVHYRMIGYDEPMQGGYSTWIEGKERWCNASFFVIRKKAYVWYDERFGMGGYDDWDFFHRMRHINGWKTAYTTLSCYQHKHSSTLKLMGDREEAMQKNRNLFKSKYGKYAEDIWNELYSEQMREDYYGFYTKL